MRLLPLLFLLCACAYAQNVSSSVRGTLVGPAGAFVPGAACTLANSATAATLSAV